MTDTSLADRRRHVGRKIEILQHLREQAPLSRGEKQEYVDLCRLERELHKQPTAG